MPSEEQRGPVITYLVKAFQYIAFTESVRLRYLAHLIANSQTGVRVRSQVCEIPPSSYTGSSPGSEEN